MNEFAGEEGFKAQVLTLPEQYALSRELRKVTASPALKYFALLAASNTTGNDTLTVIALTQEHLDKEAPIKVKSRSHGHVASSIPPLSVGELKVIVTVWPLSDSCTDDSKGAGNSAVDDSS